MKTLFRAALLATALSFTLPLAAQSATPLYTVSGKVADQGADRPITAEDLKTIGLTEIRTKVHTLGEEPRSVKGVLARDLMNFIGAEAKTMKIVALDGYEMEVPVADITSYDVVIATEIDGKALSVRDKGPAWLIYPVTDHKELDDTVYEARSVWQIKTIQFN